MNKRQYKKYVKKEYCKSWRESRYNKIVIEAKEHAIILRDMSSLNMRVIITDSKRGNMKHPLNIKVEKYAMEFPLILTKLPKFMTQ